MTVKEMHYDFKQKLNKIDSQKNRDIYVPEIDWKLNEAQELFVKLIAQPRLNNNIGFEINQRTIDDIRTIVIDQKESGGGVIPTLYDTTSYIATLPEDYWFFSKANVYLKKGNCVGWAKKVREVQHDDEHEESPFNKSSFEWREVNVRFNKEGLRIFTDGTFSVTKVLFEYLKQPKLIHNAASWKGGTYTTLDGTVLTGTQDCELPVRVHREIVDLAVMITAGDLSLPDYMMKKDKVAINQLT